MNPEAMEPFGQALDAYFGGDQSAELLIRRDDGFEDVLPVSWFFRSPDQFTRIELDAIHNCRGHVLDVGAGAGIHSLLLQAEGVRVTALDVNSTACRILAERGVHHVRCADITSFSEGPFDTLLMLGHGLGMVEDLTGLGNFLVLAHKLVSSEGQILAHTRDVNVTDNPAHLAYHEKMRRAGRYVGEIRMQFQYRNQTGPFCGWLHIDPQTLARLASENDWAIQVPLKEDAGDYLASLTPVGAA